MFLSKINIDGHLFNIKIKHSKTTKTIKLSVNPEDGLKLIIPFSVPNSIVSRFLADNKCWIIKKCDEQLKRKEQYFYLGSELELLHQNTKLLSLHKFELKDNTLNIMSPEKSSASHSVLYNGWLKLKAKQYLPNRTVFLAEKNGFKFNKITIRGQKTRWGSCSRRGNLSFNYRLMQYPVNVIDYVLIHELCHLKEMNHSKRFWGLVGEILPNYAELRNYLK